MKLPRCCLLRCAALWVMIGSQQVAVAHEGHAALPSTGVVLDGDKLLVSKAAVDAIGMKTEMIKLGNIQHKLRVNARVELPWSGQAKVSTLTAGKIQRVLVEPGQKVKAGEELARVESLELESLQAELLQTDGEVKLLKRLIKHREPLVKSGGIAGKVLLENKTELQQKQSLFEITLYKLKALGVTNDSLKALLQSGKIIGTIAVVSPIAGIIQSVDTRPGQLVESTDHLFDIVDLSTLYIVGEVLEGDAYQVRKGQKVTITFSGRSESGRVVDHIRVKIDEAKRLLRVVVVVENRKGLLRPGMFGRMAIEVAAANQEIVCPTSALIETEDGTFVLKEETKSKFSRQIVKIAMRSPDFVVVESGLFPGQRVISVGTHLLSAMFDGVPLASSQHKSGADKKKTTQNSSPSTQQNSDILLAAKSLVELPTSKKAFATSLIEGRVAKIIVKPNQVVKKGQTLAEVESKQLRNLQLELLQAAEKIRWTAEKVNRLRPLAEKGATSVREFWQLELELKTLAQKINSLRRRLSLIGLKDQDIEKLRSGKLSGADGTSLISGRIAIRSPIAGRIADIGLALGQLVHAHDSLFEIQNTDTIWIKALVLEGDAGRIKLGQQAVATFPSHPNLRVSGTIDRIAPQLVSRERVLALWIKLKLPNTEGFLKDGMLARVQISVAKQSKPVTSSVLPKN